MSDAPAPKPSDGPKRSTARSWLMGQGIAQAYAVGMGAVMAMSGMPLVVAAAALLPGALGGLGLGAIFEYRRKQREAALVAVRTGTEAEVRALYLARRQKDAIAPSDLLGMVSLAVACGDVAHGHALVQRMNKGMPKSPQTAIARAQIDLAIASSPISRAAAVAALLDVPPSAEPELRAFAAFLVTRAVLLHDVRVADDLPARWLADADQDVRAYAHALRARRDAAAPDEASAEDLTRAARLVPGRDGALVAVLEREAAAAAARAAGGQAPYRG